MPLDDHALLAGIGRGDAESFGWFRDRHAQRVHLVALGVLHDEQHAEEVAQDTFVTLWLDSSSYDASRGAPLRWLLSIARHRAIDRWRAEQCRPRCDTDSRHQLAALIAPGSSEETVIDGERRHDILTRLAALPVAQMTAIALSYYGELTQGEIAVHLGVPVGTVKSRVRLGLTHLRSGP